MACLLFVLVLSHKVSSSRAESHFLLIHRFSDVTVLSVTMRSSLLLCLAFSLAMFGFGDSLQCYSCPDGSSNDCEVKQDCNQGEDSCLKLTSTGKTFTTCMRHADCDFMTLAVRYAEPDFTFSCCQSALCNGQEKSTFQKFKEWFG
ncbi:CD59 glycoprotein-like isoform X1 [Hippoglossus hippoglossus]|uniref:CD59 glycoprotein-like isoform X1 n=2 Tax=Hippoglossus hippoglossus TaxID=8267 RepID=UPI00148B63B5|nr:CD59 glycoprotein-like isoform X1 [Hippoglossus hippoglossus]